MGIAWSLPENPHTTRQPSCTGRTPPQGSDPESYAHRSTREKFTGVDFSRSKDSLCAGVVKCQPTFGADLIGFNDNWTSFQITSHVTLGSGVMMYRTVRRIRVAKRPPGSTCPREVRRGPASYAFPGRAFTSRRLRLELLERDFLRRYTEKNLRTVNFFMLSSIAPRPAARSRRAGGRASLAHPRPDSARAGTRAGVPDAVALGADAGCEHKGQASRATGPGPRIAPAAPSPPARSTSSRQSAPPIDYAQRRADQTESASAPRLHAHPPISVHSRRSFSFSPITHSGQPHPRPAHPHQLQSARAVLPRGVVPVTASNQRPLPTPPPPSSTTPALRERHSAVSPRLPPRPLPRPPISAHALVCLISLSCLRRAALVRSPFLSV